MKTIIIWGLLIILCVAAMFALATTPASADHAYPGPITDGSYDPAYPAPAETVTSDTPPTDLPGYTATAPSVTDHGATIQDETTPTMTTRHHSHATTVPTPTWTPTETWIKALYRALMGA